jgi:hypothetical protein
MAGTLSGYRCDIPRVTTATQYLTTFANRVPCIQVLISFNDQIRVRAPLSALVHDFEDGTKKVVPSRTTHLWGALMKAALDAKKYPNAGLRVLVISDQHARQSVWNGSKPRGKGKPVGCRTMLRIMIPETR